METTLQSVTELNKEYESLKPFPTGHLALRKGYYLINSIAYTTVGEFSDIPVAKALWTFDMTLPFEGCSVEFQMLSLIPSDSEANTINFEELVGSVICVQYGKISTIETESASYNYYSVKWTTVLKADQVVKGGNLK